MNAYILLGGEDDLFMLEITDTGATLGASR